MTTRPTPDSTVVLEVIACSVADALAAERGGAHRLEVISHFEVGGLTPTLDLVKEIRSAVKLPLRVMLRESEGFEVMDEAEVTRLGQNARELSAMGVEGVVLGFLHGGKVDLELTNRILAHAPHLKATFHHAFDETDDRLCAIAELRTLQQIDRILTSGGSTDLAEQINSLSAYERTAHGEISILAGGGLDGARIKAIRDATPIREFHIGRSARVPQRITGVVSAERVRAILAGLEHERPRDDWPVTQPNLVD